MPKFVVSANYHDRESLLKWLVRRKEDPVSSAVAVPVLELRGVTFERSSHHEEIGYGCKVVATCDEVFVLEAGNMELPDWLPRAEPGLKTAIHHNDTQHVLYDGGYDIACLVPLAGVDSMSLRSSGNMFAVGLHFRNEREKCIWELMEQMQGAIAAEMRVMLGEPAIAAANFNATNQRRRIESMQECALSTSDKERHDAWIAKHVAEGWVYGVEFDSAKKTHPNLVDWDQLPGVVKSKARIFDIVAKAARSLTKLT